MSDDDLLRTVLVVAGGVVAVAAGAVWRMQAPLVIGAATLAIVGIDAIAPTAAELPRWIPLGVAGLLLLWFGATAERRLTQVRHAREAFSRLA
jgi:hypothetical protein